MNPDNRMVSVFQRFTLIEKVRYTDYRTLKGRSLLIVSGRTQFIWEITVYRLRCCFSVSTCTIVIRCGVYSIGLYLVHMQLHGWRFSLHNITDMCVGKVHARSVCSKKACTCVSRMPVGDTLCKCVFSVK